MQSTAKVNPRNNVITLTFRNIDNYFSNIELSRAELKQLTMMLLNNQGVPADLVKQVEEAI